MIEPATPVGVVRSMTAQGMFDAVIARMQAGMILVVWLTAILGGMMSPSSAHSADQVPTGPVPSAIAIAPGTCMSSLNLVLQPGQHWPQAVKAQIPPDLPPGNVSVSLPLYPDAGPATEHQAHPNFSHQADRYVKSASAEYQTSDALDGVITWYKSAFAACGYAVQSIGDLGIHGVVAAHGIVWTMKKGRDTYWMSLSFARTSGGGTSILYVAIVYTPPVYPAPGSILRVPGTPVVLTVTRYSGMNPGFGALRPLRTVTVRDSTTVRSVADEINRLPKLTGGMMSCPMDDGSHLTLHFGDAAGAAHIVTVNLTGCPTVAAPPAPPGWLYDDPQLLPRLMALVNGADSHEAAPFYDARTLRAVHVRMLGASGGRFLSTGQNGSHLLYLARGDLFTAPAVGDSSRRLAPNIADASFTINDYTALARPASIARPNELAVIDLRSGRTSQLHVPTGSVLVGRNAGIGQPGLGDALEYSLQYVWYVQGRRLVGINPQHPGTDRVRTGPFLSPPEPHRLVAVSAWGDRVAVYHPGAGIVIRDQGGQTIRRLATGAISCLIWAPDDMHLAYRSGDTLLTTNVTSGATHTLLSLRGRTVHGAAWDPWSHVLALSLAPTGAPAWESDVHLVNSNGSGSGVLRLPFSGATELRWSIFRGQTVGITRVTPHGTEAWAVTLPPVPHDPGGAG